MTTYLSKVSDILAQGENELNCPLPLQVIPNYMGINLCSVEALSWTCQDDGQMVQLTIHFIPEIKNDQQTKI